jgi:hypothetical protein
VVDALGPILTRARSPGPHEEVAPSGGVGLPGSGARWGGRTPAIIASKHGLGVPYGTSGSLRWIIATLITTTQITSRMAATDDNGGVAGSDSTTIATPIHSSQPGSTRSRRGPVTDHGTTDNIAADQPDSQTAWSVCAPASVWTRPVGLSAVDHGCDDLRAA